MFMSHGPSHGPPAIFENFNAALDFLGERETRSYQFGKQAGFLELLRNADSMGEGEIGLRYHDTHVMTLHQNGDTSFKTGGWHTRSTAAWMGANNRFSVHLYEPRSGTRKPYRYSMIRFCGHDRNIEQKFRDQFGLPSVRENNWISEYDYTGDFTGQYDIATQRPIYTGADERMQQVVRDFRAAYNAERLRRHPWYVLHDGVRFTKRGRCMNSSRVDDAVEHERSEREAERRRKLKVNGQITRYTNLTMKALAEGMSIDDLDEMPRAVDELRAIVAKGEPNGALTMRVIGQACPGDVRTWLNLHERDNEIVMGDLTPVAEQVIARKLRESLRATLV